jgi:hypothetical protein
MKKVVLAVFILLSCLAESQTITAGYQFNILPYERLIFKGPVQLDTSLYHNGARFVFNDRWKTHGTGIAGDFFIQYYLRQNKYIGFNWDISQRDYVETNRVSDLPPELTLTRNSFTLYYGMSRNKIVTRYFAEGGLTLARMNVENVDIWIDGSASAAVYRNYFEKKSLLCTGYAKVGIDWTILRVSLRSEVMLGSINNPTGIKNYYVINGISIGMNPVQTAFIGRKRIHKRKAEAELDDSYTKEESKIELGTNWQDAGGSISIIPYHTKERLVFSKFLATSVYQRKLDENWYDASFDITLGIKRTLTPDKKFFCAFRIGYGIGRKIKNIGEDIKYSRQYIQGNPYQLTETNGNITFQVNYVFGSAGIGYRTRINNYAIVEVIPVFQLNSIFDQNNVDYKFYDWKPVYFTTGTQLVYKRRHLNFCITGLKAISDLERQGYFKRGMNFNFTISNDIFFRH